MGFIFKNKLSINIIISTLVVSLLVLFMLYFRNINTNKNTNANTDTNTDINTDINKNSTINSQKAVTKTYIPQISDKVFINPYMGFVPSADAKEVVLPFSMVYAGISWRDLETEKGVYNFENFENKYKFDSWRKKGIKIILRVYMDYPSDNKHMDIPDWLYHEIGARGIWYNYQGKQGFSPNYDNPVLIENHKNLIKALAEKYDNDSSIAFIELGSVGHWGEWNTTYLQNRTTNFPLANVSDKYVQPYVDYFKNKKLLMRRPYQIAKDNNMGLFNDSFGDIEQTEDYFLNWIQNGYTDPNVKQTLPAMPDFWKTAPSGGEFANSPGREYITSGTIKRTIAMLKNSYTSWLGPSCPVYESLPEDEQNNLNSLLKEMGYRFSVKTSTFQDFIAAGETQKGTFTLTNGGNAPFYYKWPLSISINDKSGYSKGNTALDYDIRSLVSGDADIQYSMPANSSSTPGGVYDLNLYLADPDTGEPAVEFANVSTSESKYSLLGQFTLKMAGNFNTDDYSTNTYYNYVSDKNGNFTIDSIPKDKNKAAENSTFIYQVMNSGDNWKAAFSLQHSENLKMYEFYFNKDDKNGKLFQVYSDSSSNFVLKSADNKKTVTIGNSANLSVVKKGNSFTVYKSDSSGSAVEIYQTKVKQTADQSIKTGLQSDFKNLKEAYTTIIKNFSLVKNE